ncbi:hypothetical protein LR48_Vigan232s001100 [Vigna angularis]|uniref:Uncharacterized protein n=1 Tax=Phaseolus angularis TaxID=3914 RepID=A0A0L9T7R3_PHAAN|nr:hypothetical protein LR48_Vigan232s001100 [Vigna angularis]
MTDARCQAKRIRKSDSGIQVSADEQTFVLTREAKLAFSENLLHLCMHPLFRFLKNPTLYILFIFSLRTHSISLLRSPFSHRRSTSGVKSFQINRSVCEVELLELSSVDGRETGSGEIVFCLWERSFTLRGEGLGCTIAFSLHTHTSYAYHE